MKLEISQQIFEKYQISPKSVQWEQSCSVQMGSRTDGRTDVTQPVVAFRKFPNALKTLVL